MGNRAAVSGNRPMDNVAVTTATAADKNALAAGSIRVGNAACRCIAIGGAITSKLTNGNYIIRTAVFPSGTAGGAIR